MQCIGLGRLLNGGESVSPARVAYATGCHVVNSARHEAVLVFPGHAHWKCAIIWHYPPGLAADPFANSHGVAAMDVGLIVVSGMAKVFLAYTSPIPLKGA